MQMSLLVIIQYNASSGPGRKKDALKAELNVRKTLLVH